MKEKKEKPLQLFKKEYLEQCRDLSPEEIIEFLDNFRKIHGEKASDKSHLISIKIPESLLKAFRLKAQLEKTPYQTQIKRLMVEWLK